VHLDAQTHQLTKRAGDLRWPWSIALLPDGDFLITEREGRLLRIAPSGRRRVLTGGPPTLFAGQGGYFDVILDTAFERNRTIYLSYAEGTETANGTAVYRARLGESGLEEGRQILRVTQDKITPRHYGGRLLMIGDEILLTTGDGFEHREAAQDPDSELGKVLRIDREGTPLGLRANRHLRRRVWSLGHRNPQGLAHDPVNNLIFLHEHGPRGGDEINRLEPGFNYGWPLATHGKDYSGAYVSPFHTLPGAVDPLWVWTPAIGPSGMAFYSGRAFPEWTNSLLVGALVGRAVHRLQMDGARIVFEEVLFERIGARVRDVRVFGERIFVLTDGARGTLYEVSRY